MRTAGEEVPLEISASRAQILYKESNEEGSKISATDTPNICLFSILLTMRPGQVPIAPLTQEEIDYLVANIPSNFSEQQIARYTQYNVDLHQKKAHIMDFSRIPFGYDFYVSCVRGVRMHYWKHSVFFNQIMQYNGKAYPDYDIGRDSMSIYIE